LEIACHAALFVVMPFKKPGRLSVNASISFPPGLLARARERARNLGLPFSAYVQKGVERDLAERGAIVYIEQPGGRSFIAVEAAPSAKAALPKPSHP
jgi:hypothetical protein